MLRFGIRPLIAWGLLAGGIIALVRNPSWLAFAVIAAALLLLAHLPARGRLYECPRCGGVFQISVFEYYLCPDRDELREVNCRACGMNQWVRPAKR